ncbi:hypothetical protein Tco_0209158 [Tanacetum coccineum]
MSPQHNSRYHNHNHHKKKPVKKENEWQKNHPSPRLICPQTTTAPTQTSVRWTRDEEKLLCEVWVGVSENNDIGNDQILFMDFYLHTNDQILLGCFQAFHCDAIMGQMLYQFQGNQRDYFSNDTYRDFDNLEAELKKAHARITKLQRKQMGNNNKIALARFRIANLEQIIEEIQVRHQADNESLLNAIYELKNSQKGPSNY